MITNIISTIALTSVLGLGQLVTPLVLGQPLASHQISLEKRYYPVQKENILLNLAYLDGRVTKKSDINWDELNKPFKSEFTLQPGQTFAYHDDVLPEYKGKVVITTKAHFNWNEGFKAYGYLVGDGVCHSASLIYWVAKEAGLDTYAPTNHNFMAIPGIDNIYGVSIYANPNASGTHARQNLYITNNKDKAVTFKFEYDGVNLKATVVESN